MVAYCEISEDKVSSQTLCVSSSGLNRCEMAHWSCKMDHKKVTTNSSDVHFIFSALVKTDYGSVYYTSEMNYFKNKHKIKFWVIF